MTQTSADEEWFSKTSKPLSKKKRVPPSLGQQSSIIEQWWKLVKK